MGTPKEWWVRGDIRQEWNLLGGRGLGEATRKRHPGGLKHDHDGESTCRMTPNLGLKTKVKAGTDMWAESADMQTEAVKVGETPQEAGGRGQRGLGPSSVGNRKKEETEQGESKRQRSELSSQHSPSSPEPSPHPEPGHCDPCAQWGPGLGCLVTGSDHRVFLF